MNMPSSFSSWTMSVVFEANDFIFSFKRLLSSFFTYTFNASWEKRGSLANKFSSLIKSVKSANSGSANLWSPFYMLPIFYNFAPVATWLCHIQCLLVAGCSVLFSPWLLLQCISKAILIFHMDHQFCIPRFPGILTWNNGSPVDFLWMTQFVH